MKVAQIRASFVLKGAKSLVRRKQVKNVCEKSWKQEAREQQQQQKLFQFQFSLDYSFACFSFFVFALKATQKKHILNDDWRANEALKKKKVQHNNNIVEWKRSKKTACAHALITLFLLWLSLLLLLPCSCDAKGEWKIERALWGN